MESKFYGAQPSTDIIVAMAWVMSKFQVQNKVLLRVYGDDPRVGNTMTKGKTCKMKANFGGHIEVRLYLSKGKTYPYATRYVVGLPPLLISSFVEEVVLVLAHEMRHAVQFDTGIWQNLSDYELELDAECAGYSVLDSWRTSKRKPLDGTGKFTYPTL